MNGGEADAESELEEATNLANVNDLEDEKDADDLEEEIDNGIREDSTGNVLKDHEHDN